MFACSSNLLMYQLTDESVNIEVMVNFPNVSASAFDTISH